MGRWIFLSAVAFAAYRYIARANKKMQPQLVPKYGDTEVLPPIQSEAKLISGQSLAAEPEPHR